MDTIRLTIEGMHCGGCVRRVTAALTAVPGVTIENVSVGSAVVAADGPSAVANTVAALSDAGYKATAETTS